MTAAPRLGRRVLPPHRRHAGALGPQGPRPPAARRRRDRPRRGLRQWPHDHGTCSSACRRSRDRRRRLALDDRARAPASSATTGGSTSSSPTSPSSSSTSPSTRSSPTRPSTGSPITSASSRGSSRRCAPAAGIEAQFGGEGNVAEFIDGDRGASRDPLFAAHLEGLDTALELRGTEETETQAACRRLRRRGDLARPTTTSSPTTPTRSCARRGSTPTSSAFPRTSRAVHGPLRELLPRAGHAALRPPQRLRDAAG